MYAQFLRFTTQLWFLFSLSILCFSLKVTAHEDEHDKHDEANIEKIIVQATRSGRIADDQPVRVELINQEEIQEKAAMRPGNISMLVAETGGVRM